MSSVNKAILVGNLGANPEIKTFENGERICRFSLATNSNWKDKSTNEWREKTVWHQIVLRDDFLVDLANRRLTGGVKVYVEGAIEMRSWENAKGEVNHSVEIVLRKFRGKMKVLNGGRERAKPLSGSPNRTEPQPNKIIDDIPF